MIAGPDVVVFQ